MKDVEIEAVIVEKRSRKKIRSKRKKRRIDVRDSKID